MTSKAFLPLCLAGIALMSILFQSCDCSKKYSCPGFNDELLVQWFPYDDGTVIKFNSAGQSATIFTLDSIKTSQPYELESTRPITCIAEKVFAAQEQLANGRPAFGITLQKIEPMRGAESREFVISLLGSNIYVDHLYEDRFLYVTQSGQHGLIQSFSSIVLDGKTFNNVHCAVFDSSFSKKQTIHKLYISKGQGVIGYETFSPQILWVKE